MVLMRRNAIAFVFGVCAAGPAFAQSAERVAAHTDWSVFVANDPKECYIVSPPKTSVAKRDGQPAEVERGDIRLFVAFRPGENVSNEVSFTGGYPFREGSTVTLAVGGAASRSGREPGIRASGPGPIRPTTPGRWRRCAAAPAPPSAAPRRAAPPPRTPSRSRASPPRSRTRRRAAAEAALAIPARNGYVGRRRAPAAVPRVCPVNANAPIQPDVIALPRRQPDAARANLVGMSRAGLAAALAAIGTPEPQVAMRTSQVWQWLYHRGARDFAAMSNLSRGFRESLAAAFAIERPEVVTRQVSADGTRKYLLRVAGGQEIETVYIPEADRGTLCVSSQVGCTLTCSFCHTGTQRLVRNLTAAEIVGQIMVARDDLGDWGRKPDEKRLVSNLVLMGMGEPLYNFDAVRDAMKVAMDGEGIALSRRRITLSTSGVVPEIARVGEEIGCLLAISFHATTDPVRDALVPINRKWPIAALLDACREYPRLSNSERITFEYVMLKGVNDSDADARRLVKLISGIPAKINLIPFNPWPGAPYERSDPERIEAFGAIVNRAGYASPVRTPRGEDIMAACGQLKSASERARRARA